MIPELSDSLICMRESYSYVEATGMMTTVIVTDACIDWVIDITNQNIGYQGMVKTNFNFRSKMPDKSIGFRFKPGAFFALTGMDATAAADVEFDNDNFPGFSLAVKLTDTICIQ